MIKCEGNRFAVNCCDLVVEGKAPFSALYIYGDDECSKRMILNYIECGVYGNNPNAKILRVGPNVITAQGSESFLENCKNADILMIEDFQNITLNYITNDFFLSFLNAPSKNQKMIITSNKPLTSFAHYKENPVLARLLWEMSVRLLPPNKEDGLFALRDTAKRAGLVIDESLEKVFSVILDFDNDNIGNVLSDFRRIYVRADLENKELTPGFAEKVLFEGFDMSLLAE